MAVGVRRSIRVAGISGWFYLKSVVINRFTFVLLLTQPLALTVTATYMLRGRPDFEATYVVVGVALTALWTNVLFIGSNAMREDRWSGVLELMEAAPAPLFAIYGGKMLATLVLSTISLALCYIVTVGLFGYDLGFSLPAAFVVGVMLGLGALWSLGMLFSPLYLIWPPAGALMSASEFPIYMLCGFLFPVSLLPAWLAAVSFVLPPYWAAVALHGTSSLELEDAPLLAAWLALAASTLLVSALAAWTFQAFLRIARSRGMLAAV